jgi:release factor glutamine methyltransferase
MEENRESRSVWTPLKIIQWAVPYLSQKGIPNPRFDVELLISHALKMDRLKVYLQFDRPLDAQELEAIRHLLKRRAEREPIQYIIGRREFFGLDFQVGSGVLIPRPETEQLVEQAIECLKPLSEEERLVLDLGTGSGCIAIAIAKSIPCRVWAVDISQKALELARRNGENLEVGPFIQWRQGHWFEALKPEDPPQFSVITSNPPYIPLGEKADLAPEVMNYEPSEALFAENEGLKAYEEVAQGLKSKLTPNGTVLFEIHANAYDKVSGLLVNLGFKETLYRDLQGHPRVIKIRNE